MYNIYVNGRVLILLSEEELNSNSPAPDKNTLISAYVGKKKIFRQCVDLLIKSPEIKIAYIWAADLNSMWQVFTESFELIIAAGGLVTNPDDQILVFLRHGIWDLPKGKIDQGEVPTEAALREVEEECGLHQLELGKFICHSYHIYLSPKKAVLKKTWWYQMKTHQLELTPQVEEGIEIVQWEAKDIVLARIHDFYPNLHGVLTLGTQM